MIDMPPMADDPKQIARLIEAMEPFVLEQGAGFRLEAGDLGLVYGILTRQIEVPRPDTQVRDHRDQWEKGPR